MDARSLCLESIAFFLNLFLWFLSDLAASQTQDPESFVGDKIIDAINCGGKAHTDVFGVSFRADSLQIGTASDFGRRYLLGRVPPPDQILYQTERYHSTSFQYDIRVPDDGQYVLVLKFSEVYFNGPNQKVFDVVVNDHPVVNDLDIFAKVGRAIAHDEVIPFSVSRGKLEIHGEESDFDGRLAVKMVKGDFDNPKLNALYVLKGTIEDVPELPPLDSLEEEEPEEQETEPMDPERRSKYASGPKKSDPYAAQDQSQMFLPILLALACFFPVLFCLCKL